MHIRHLVTPHAQPHLARGFKERQRLDVTDRAADLDNSHICLAIKRGRSASFDKGLNLIGDMRNHLHRLAQIFSAALLADHAFIDLAGGEIIGFAHLGRDEALVVSQIQIGLGAIFSNENLAMLERAHRARIDVDIRIQLEHRDFEATRLQDGRK